jgi:hypothetical protein
MEHMLIPSKALSSISSTNKNPTLTPPKKPMLQEENPSRFSFQQKYF